MEARATLLYIRATRIAARIIQNRQMAHQGRSVPRPYSCRKADFTRGRRTNPHDHGKDPGPRHHAAMVDHELESHRLCRGRKHGHDRLCWLMQKRAAKRAYRGRLEARAAETMPLVPRTPLALEITCCALTKRVKTDPTGSVAMANFQRQGCACH